VFADEENAGGRIETLGQVGTPSTGDGGHPNGRKGDERARHLADTVGRSGILRPSDDPGGYAVEVEPDEE
jgi:hypothetical protein